MKSIIQKLDALGNATNGPAVTVSLNTHRTHPDTEKDKIVLKKLINEAEEAVIKDYGKRPVKELLEKLSLVTSNINYNYNLESLHIFLSNEIQDVIRTDWPVARDSFFVGDHFEVQQLIKAVNRLEDYLILELSEGGVHIYEVLNDQVIEEIQNGDFPFASNPHYLTHSDKASDAAQVDNKVREFFNKVDKAVVRVTGELQLPVIVISSETNYSHLLHVADKPKTYVGHCPINYNSTKPHELAQQAWEKMKAIQQKRTEAIIASIQDAVGEGKVLTDLQEIYQAALDGRADSLIVDQDYSIPVEMTGPRTFDILAKDDSEDAITEPELDLINLVAWNTRKNGGNVIFTSPGQIGDLGRLALLVRY